MRGKTMWIVWLVIGLIIILVAIMTFSIIVLNEISKGRSCRDRAFMRMIRKD